jgi:hypothetical protein
VIPSAVFDRITPVGLVMTLLTVGCDEPPKPQRPKAEPVAKADEAEPKAAAPKEPATKVDLPAEPPKDEPSKGPEPSEPVWTMGCTANGSPLKLTAAFRPRVGVDQVAIDDGKGHSMSWSSSSGLVMFADVEQSVLAFKSGPGATGREYFDFYALPKSMKMKGTQAKFEGRVEISGFEGADAIRDLELACTVQPPQEGDDAP